MQPSFSVLIGGLEIIKKRKKGKIRKKKTKQKKQKEQETVLAHQG